MDLSELSSNPNRHPWEMSRADFLLSVIERHVKLNKQSELLDVGAGDLFFSERIHGETSTRIDAVDSAFDEEGPRNEAIQKIKYLDSVLHKKYDAICALDVLEHIENDREFFNILLNMLKPQAALMITVPAFNFLFSQHDHNLRHFRRYRLSELKTLIEHSEQFEICEGFYFFHSLFFARMFEKIGQKIRGKKIETEKTSGDQPFQSINQWKFTEHHPVTRSLGTFLTMDALVCRALARLKIKVPGLSLCMIIKRIA